MKIMLLLGAGFPTIWGGKITSEVTQKMEATIDCEWSNPYKRVHCELSNLLGETRNFEKYIDLLERSLPDLDRKFEQPSFLKHLIKGGILVYNKGNSFSGNDESCYYAARNELFKVYLNVIAECLSYSHTDAPINENLKRFIEKMLPHQLGIYSLNYDMVICDLFGDAFKIFNGFEGAKPNPRRILGTDEKLKYFNLHGSLRFIDGFVFTHINEFHLSDKYEWPSLSKIRDGSKLFLPIVTGGDKLGKTQISPMKYFSSSFHMDLSKCDLLITMGYSFADDHINDCIRDLIPSNALLLIVDYKKENQKEKHEEIRRHLASWGNLSSTSDNREFYHMNDNVSLYLGGAECFLKDYNRILNECNFKI